MLKGRLQERQMLIIKENFARTLSNNNLKNKALLDIISVIKAFVARVNNKYSLKVVTIYQDNNTVTTPQRGRLTYKEQAENIEIKIKRALTYTYKPNSTTKRVG